MRIVLQRVSRASVSVDGAVVGAIDRGLLLLVGVAPGDTDADALWLVNKIADLRIFPDDAGRMNLSLRDVSGGLLVVSQFTLYGDCRRGRRPGFSGAAPPDLAEARYLRLCALFEAAGISLVQRGVFGADMRVELVNDGPVTLILDYPQPSIPG